MLKTNDILAVVVSYNGGETIVETVNALENQVGGICIVDNGSNAETLRILNSLRTKSTVTVVYLGRNYGIGHALNIGVRRAMELGFEWLLTMDQDSSIDHSMIKAFQEAVRRDPTAVSLTPMIFNNHRSTPTSTILVDFAITSGNLVRVDVIERIGFYDEKLFIDSIDFDFCLRLKLAGYGVQRVSDAFMRHQLGERAQIHRFARRFYAQHSPNRRYYMYRNYLYLAEKYIMIFPKFVIKLGLLQLMLFVLIAIFDRHPLRSYKAIVGGIYDYLKGVTGPNGRPEK